MYPWQSNLFAVSTMKSCWKCLLQCQASTLQKFPFVPFLHHPALSLIGLDIHIATVIALVSLTLDMQVLFPFAPFFRLPTAHLPHWQLWVLLFSGILISIQVLLYALHPLNSLHCSLHQHFSSPQRVLTYLSFWSMPFQVVVLVAARSRMVHLKAPSHRRLNTLLHLFHHLRLTFLLLHH